MSAEKESTDNKNLEKCAVILLDIAGTTTSNSFIKDTLFPFAASNAEEYLKSHWNEEVVKDAVKQLNEYNEKISVSEVAEIIKTATEKDEINKGVKTLQGLIYRQGYEDGKLKAPVFPDVSSSLENWSKNHRVAIYSSGSIESQKLLFAHTTEGDLSVNIGQYFDLSVGSKAEVSSYEKIAKELAVTPEEIIYINDDVEEAKAAGQAGIRSILIIREGNENIPEEKQKEFKVIKSFADLSVEVSGKRKIEEEETAEEPPTKVAKTEEPDVVVNKAGEEEKNVSAEEEPMEIDSTNEIKDVAGESELESAANKDENVMEIDVKVNVENKKTEIETEQREDALNEVVQKSDSEIVEEKPAADLQSQQTNSDSVGKPADSLEKVEGFSEKNAQVSSEVQADSTEALTDSTDKMETTLTAGPPQTEIISAAIEKNTSETNSINNAEDAPTTKSVAGIVSTVIENDASKPGSTEKLIDSVHKTEDTLTIKPPPAEIVSRVIDRDTSEASATEKHEDSVDKMEDVQTTEICVTGVDSASADCKEKLADSTDKMEDVLTIEPSGIEIVCKVIEKDMSKTVSADSVDKKEDELKMTSPISEVVSTVIQKDASETDSAVKPADSVDKMEDTLAGPPRSETVCRVSEKKILKTDSGEKLTDSINKTGDILPIKSPVTSAVIERDTSEIVSTKTGDNSNKKEETLNKNDKVDNMETDDKNESKIDEKSKEEESEIHRQVSEADEGGNKETQSEVEDKEADPLSSETKMASGDAVMEVCETMVEEQNNTSKVEEIHNKCKNICNKASSESNKAESAQVNNEEVNTTVTQDDVIESSTTNTGTPVQKQECTSEKKEVAEAESTEKTSTEENAVECEMRDSDGTEDKVNGNEAESSRNDEKENKSELANGTASGVETGSDVNENGDVANATEEEIKVKKLEENPDSTAVSVEA